jgi:anti-sigma-K factor RskA
VKVLHPDLRELLAAEHVLGMHSPRVRARFLRLLKEDFELRALVEQWETRLHPLALGLTEETPPTRVWEAIQQQIRRRDARKPKPALSFWRYAALLTSAAAVALVLYLGVAPRTDTPYMVAVMTAAQAEPMMIATWQDADEPVLRIQVLAHREMAPDSAWELWCLPGKNQPPMSLGLITTESVQTVKLNERQMRELTQAEALAMSVEPKGGSPTGLPTGPVLASGPLKKI